MENNSWNNLQIIKKYVENNSKNPQEHWIIGNSCISRYGFLQGQNIYRNEKSTDHPVDKV